ncbi:MAG: YybH family protein [Geminicoccaceae bacterium]
MTEDVSKANDQARIRALIEDWAQALRAKDVDGVLAHFAADVVTFDLAPPLRSTGADASGLQAWFSTWESQLGYEIRDLNITAADDAAFCHCLSRLSGTKVGGAKNEVWFRQTLCFRKIGGTWKIAHQHESVPFYMDGSYRAAVDLEPQS